MFFEVLIFVILSVVIGLMFLFFGFPFFRILLPIFAFFVGVAFGYNGLESLLGAGFVSGTLGLILGVVLGLVFAALAYFFYELVIVLFGVAAGYVLGAGFMMALGAGPRDFFTVLVGIIVAVVLGIVFVMVAMPKFLVVLFTAAAGAMAVVMGILVLFGEVPEVAASLQLTTYVVQGSFFWLIVWGVLAAIGMIFQYSLASANGEDLSGNYSPAMSSKAKSSKKKK